MSTNESSNQKKNSISVLNIMRIEKFLIPSEMVSTVPYLKLRQAPQIADRQCNFLIADVNCNWNFKILDLLIA